MIIKDNEKLMLMDRKVDFLTPVEKNYWKWECRSFYNDFYRKINRWTRWIQFL